MSDNQGMDMNNIFNEMSKVAETINGLKKMFTNEGWSEENAQALVIQLFLGASNGD